MRFLAPAGITATITSVASRFGGKFDGLRAAASHLSPLGFAGGTILPLRSRMRPGQGSAPTCNSSSGSRADWFGVIASLHGKLMIHLLHLITCLIQSRFHECRNVRSAGA